jgi:haloalkane dehalogenase
MAAVHTALGTWDGPVQVLFADRDPIFGLRTGERLAAHIPGAGALEVVAGAGHFLQEDAGPEVAARILRFLDRSRAGRD